MTYSSDFVVVVVDTQTAQSTWVHPATEPWKQHFRNLRGNVFLWSCILIGELNIALCLDAMTLLWEKENNALPFLFSLSFKERRWASRVHSSLRHCIAVFEASLQTRVWSKAVSQPALTGRPMRRCTIGPASFGLGEGFAGRDFLVPLCSNDSLWRAWRLQADFGCQLDGVSSDTLVQLASVLSDQCVKKQWGLAGLCYWGCMALDIRLSWVRRGVAVSGQVCNYQLGRKKG